MKVFIIAVICGFFFLSTHTAYANGDVCEHRIFKHIFNECATHTVDTQRDEPDTSVGVGADIVIFKDGSTIHEKLERLEEVVVEYRADFNGYDDTHHSVYAVARLDASDVLPGIWGKIKSLFSRGE